MILTLDRKKHETIVNQLINQIKQLIDDGTLYPGAKLPSSRELAETLGVNRTSIINAYDELWAQGYVESTPGSYTFVRKRAMVSGFTHSASTSEIASGLFNSGEQDQETIKKFITDFETTENELIDLKHLTPDIGLIDKKTVLRCLKESISTESQMAFDYVHPQGFPPLRKEILKHMRFHSIRASDEEILITNGSQQSLYLIFKVFSKPGDILVLETPSYTLLYPLIQIFRLKSIEIPVEDHGMDIARLKELTGKKPVRFIYTMPTFQNPAGVSMTQPGREELLNLFEDKNCIIIEDSIEEEMKYFGKAHLPLKAIDNQNRVIYLGTFSKVLAPGLRTGWIIADRNCIEKLTTFKTILEISSNSLSQVFLYRFCNSGAYELHLRRMMRVFRRRMKIAVSSIKKYVPSGKISWLEPSGGFLIWMKIRCSPIEDIESYFRAYGVKINDGRDYFRRTPEDNYIRISISGENEDSIEEGIKRIGKAIALLNPDSTG